jgi:hypothetical protein
VVQFGRGAWPRQAGGVTLFERESAGGADKRESKRSGKREPARKRNRVGRVRMDMKFCDLFS